MKNLLLNNILLRKNIYLSRAELDSYRFRLLRKQLKDAYLRIPFYKNEFDKAGVDPRDLSSLEELSSYPIINKDIVRANNFTNRNAFAKYNFKSHTSGSTGQPMWTYYDFISWIRKKYIVKARARIECGVKLNDKIAVFESISPDYNDNANILLQKIKSLYRVFSIFEQPRESFQKLINFSPDVIYGSPSFLFRLSRYVYKNNFKVPSVKKIFTSSEYLQENVREYIKEKFEADVYDIYGSTEFKEVAWECEKHEGYHINEDEVIIEILKEEKPAAPGIIGNIVITDLRNKVMPLIRYQMNDKGLIMHDKCSCGRTFSTMRPYAGRSSEYIVLPDDEILSPYLFTTSIEKTEGILQYQIIQLDKNRLLVNVVCSPEYYKNISESLIKILKQITNSKMEIEIERKTKIDVEENGKFKVVKNLILDQKGEKI